MVLQKNVFVERVLPNSIIRKLSDEKMEVYRRPFASAGEDSQTYADVTTNDSDRRRAHPYGEAGQRLWRLARSERSA